ncbi:hypothetical protein ACH5RR_010113 [Cinchona calisaya]|uniref:LTI65/LTI78 PGEED repeat domain-containing protein n=1 Tax=Cinchona calisaya TaxID=153742 RepID=A0ABD3AG25_9GENT
MYCSMPDPTLWTSEIREHSSNRSAHKWDAGVFVKEYIMNKLEPEEDDRALSEVIYEAISPKKGAGDNMGVVEKVREAITSLLQHEESPQLASKGYMVEPSKLTTKTTNLSTNIPISTKIGVPSRNSTSMSSSFRGASSVEEHSKRTFKATNLSSVIPVLTKIEVQPTNGIFSTNVNISSHLPISYGASSLEKALKEKIKEMSSNVPISSTTEVPTPNYNVNLSSYAP